MRWWEGPRGVRDQPSFREYLCGRLAGGEGSRARSRPGSLCGVASASGQAGGKDGDGAEPGVTRQQLGAGSGEDVRVLPAGAHTPLAANCSRAGQGGLGQRVFAARQPHGRAQIRVTRQPSVTSTLLTSRVLCAAEALAWGAGGWARTAESRRPVLSVHTSICR